MQSEFAKLDTVIIGISPDSVERQKKFEDKEDLTISLLSDENKAVLEKYGFYGEKKNYGRTVVGVIRSTALIGKNGKAVKVFRNIKAKGHAERILKEAQAAFA